MDLIEANKEALSKPKQGLTYGLLGVWPLHFQAHAVASFATNNDISSQVGYLILLCGKTDACNVLEHSSRKSRRAVRPLIGAELYTLTDAFDCFTMIAVGLSRVFGKRIPVRISTDSKQAFDIITRGKKPTERRLAIDFLATREAYQWFDVESVDLVRCENNPAEAFTKFHNKDMLDKILTNDVDDTLVEKWIFRNAPEKNRTGLESKPDGTPEDNSKIGESREYKTSSI